MMVFITNHERSRCFANFLEFRRQTLDCRPGSANIQVEATNVSVRGRHLQHHALNNYLEILRPLIYDLRTGRDYDDAVDFVSRQQSVRDRARCNGLS